MSPIKELIASAISSSLHSTSVFLRTVPVVSSVSVSVPSSILHSYSLSLSSRNVQSFVAFPRHTIRTPSAAGSRVPVCPIFFCFNIPRSTATASMDVNPGSLYTFISPLYILLQSAKLFKKHICILFFYSGKFASFQFINLLAYSFITHIPRPSPTSSFIDVMKFAEQIITIIYSFF